MKITLFVTHYDEPSHPEAEEAGFLVRLLLPALGLPRSLILLGLLFRLVPPPRVGVLFPVLQPKPLLFLPLPLLEHVLHLAQGQLGKACPPELLPAEAAVLEGGQHGELLPRPGVLLPSRLAVQAEVVVALARALPDDGGAQLPVDRLLAARDELRQLPLLGIRPPRHWGGGKIFFD